MRTLAIGDIHGCATALRTLLDAIALTPEDTLVTLGDYVDDGPDSNSVIGLLLRVERKCNLVPLLGNHEQMMLEARHSDERMTEWLRCGGGATLKSYRRANDTGQLSDVPDAHWKFLETRCVNYFESQKHFFVHANAYPDMDLDAQPEYMLRWEQLHDATPHQSGKIMVCGHTSQKDGKILDLHHAICIDTRACKGGWLTCLDVDSRKFWQANQEGELKTGRI